MFLVDPNSIPHLIEIHPHISEHVRFLRAKLEGFLDGFDDVLLEGDGPSGQNIIYMRHSDSANLLLSLHLLEVKVRGWIQNVCLDPECLS